MTVLVTGATGTVGSNVVHELRGRGAHVRAFVRDPQRARTVLDGDVDLAVGDLGDVASMARALDGADRMFLLCGNVPDQLELERNAIDAAADAGIRRIVKLSAPASEIGSPVAMWDWHARLDEHLQSADVPSVIVKPLWYMTNLLAGAETIRQMGRLFLPFADAKMAMIDPRDVAAVAAVTLTEDGHDGRTYELTGPEALTFHQVAQELTAVLDKPVEYVPVPDEAALQAMTDGGLPDWLARNLVTMAGFIRQGVGAQVTDVVRVLTGREPRSLNEFVRDHAAAFGG